MNVCTIVAKNYLAHARVLARSFREHHPDGRFTVLLLDEIDGHFDPAEEPFELLTPFQIGLPEFLIMAGAYDVLELSTAVKPWLLRTLLDHDDHVVYLDPDIRVFAPLDEVAELAREHGMVLTPHNVAAMPRDGKKPSETDILIAGAYNLGFIALGQRDATHEFLDWWAERLRTDCIVDPDRGYFVDQRWVDLVPGMVPSVHFLRDPGYNVAYWNLHSRTLRREGDDVTVNGSPLRFFHFSGYDPRHPERLSKHQNRIELAADPELRALCDEYGRLLIAAGFEEASPWPYTYAETPGGIPLQRAVRRLYADGVRRDALGRSVFDAEGEADLVAYAHGPAEGADPGVNRFVAALHDSRADLRSAFPDLGPGAADGMLDWVDERREGELAAVARLLSPPPVTRPVPEDIASPPAEEQTGVNVAGYLSAELGVGEIGRQVIAALDTQDVPVLPIKLIAHASRQGHAYTASGALDAPFPINLLCVNADATPPLAEEAGPAFFEGRHTIGWWWWEVGAFPESLAPAFEHVDEIWVGSQFVADTLAAVSPVPVVRIPTPVSLPPSLTGRPEAEPDAARPFTFLFIYDYNSVTERKNPRGAIEAFRRAFPDPSGAGVRLVLKSINHERSPEAHASVRDAAAGVAGVAIIDQYLPAAEKDELLASCDAYLSLHRSEGFGLTMAEAMLLGKPVIATDYSGSRDFVRTDTAYPVRCTTVPVGPGQDPYPADAEWAEPDLDHAAELMRQVVNDRPGAAARGAAGRAFVRRHHGLDVAGAAMAARLATIQRARRIVPVTQQSANAIRATHDLIDAGVPRGTGARLSPKRLLRALAVRASGPVLFQQQENDRALLWSIVESERAARERALATSARAQAATLALERRMSAELAAVRSSLHGDEAPARHAPPRRRDLGRPTVSLCLLSGGSPARLRAILEACRPHVDEIVVAADRDRDVDLLETVRDLADRRLRVPSGPFRRQFAWLHEQCAGDWILRLDDDEMPGRELLDALPDLLGTKHLSAHAVLRRWLTPDATGIISAPPWGRDYQVRVVRNVPGALRFDGKVHTLTEALGERRLNALPLYHADLAINDLAARRAKAERYESATPGLLTDGFPVNDMYVPETLGPLPTEPVPDTDRELVAALLDGDRSAPGPAISTVVEVDDADLERHDPDRTLGPTAYRSRLELIDPPATLRAGATRHLELAVRNDGDATWPSGEGAEPRICIGHRWHRIGGDEEAVEGPRTPLPETLRPGTAIRMFVGTHVPETPGRYVFEVDVVHENVRWFDTPVRAEIDVARDRG